MARSNENDMNPDVRRVSGEIASRLTELGIWLSGDEDPEDLVSLQEAVERFELAVESRGGDLMVDEGPAGQTTEPDDPHFALPRRDERESVDRYLDRLARATDDVLRHQPKP
jgi:hypothetical protein